MHPSRPSSSDPNAPYRDAIASLANCNFFADDEVTEQPTESAHLPNQFAALRPHGLTRRGNVTAADSAPTPAVTIATLRQYLSALGYSSTNLILDGALQSRLTAAGLSPATLLTALQIAHADHHPLLANLGVNDYQHSELKSRLAGIVIRAAGFRTRIRNVAASADDNPERLITALFNYIRDL